MSLQAWLQERQYTTPYHWRQSPIDEREYQLRTRLVLKLARLAGSEDPAYVRSDVGRVRLDPPFIRPRLLDIGCGDARFTADAALYARVVGIDVSQRALAYAREFAPTGHFLEAGGAALPFASNSFDVVTLLDVIEQIPDADERRVISEATRVLRRSGRLVISTNTDRSSCELTHYRHYSVARFRSLFDGLRRVELVGLIPYFPTLKVWMATPVVWRFTSGRVRTCAPHDAHVVVGAAMKP